MADFDQLRNDLISAHPPDLNTEYRAAVFAEKACRILADGEVLEGAELCTWKGTGPRQRKVAITAGALHPEDGSATLVLAHFDGSVGDAPTVSLAELDRLFRGLAGFAECSLAGDMIDRIDAPEAREFATELHRRNGSLSKLRLYLVTDCRLSVRVRELPGGSVEGIETEFHVWDVTRLNELGNKGHEPLDIAIKDQFGSGIPALAAHMETDKYQAYLCVVPGGVLADLYGRYGSRLLETNVRGFLSERGLVNRGMRATIQNRPHMFFAYNNGLTATAAHVITERIDGEERIVRIKDLQIVNGGQTTASLFWARKKHKASLDRVFVQMKLSVVPEQLGAESLNDVVSDISRFANSQNKVSDADLFANHPFHRQMEKISRRAGVPARDGGQYQTYWFYERARAQYANERAGLTAANTKIFDRKYPKAHVVQKTDLAAFVNVWEMLPHVVCLGSQKSFKRFADMIQSRWERNPEQFNEIFFKRAIGVASLLQSLRLGIQKAEWYQSYHSALANYTVAMVGLLAAKEARKVNLLGIWVSQGISAKVEVALLSLARALWFGLRDHPDRQSKPLWAGNPGEWFKAERCWEAARGLGLSSPEGLDELFISDAQYANQDVAGLNAHRVDTTIDAQAESVRLRAEGYFHRMKEWNQEDPVLSGPEFEAVCRAISMPPESVIGEAECRLLMEAKQRAELNGFLR